ncbi:MAG: cyclase family protein [Actinobacteria bacterium]|nr:MAG: cyclase family protein [Actinomycetota bacterium]
MRPVPEPVVPAWSPPAYEVDGDGKVVGAQPGSPNNWGRWGDHDQRGTLNLITPERIVAAARLIRTGKRFSLALPIGLPSPAGRQPPIHLIRATTGDSVLGAPGLQFSDDWIVMALQASTQLDGLSHIGADDLLYNGFWGGVVTAREGARRLGIHHLADGVVGRGVLLDVAGHAGVARLAREEVIESDRLEEVAQAQGVAVMPGDALLVRTGYLGWAMETGEREPNREPGISRQAVPWLAERDVALLATDTPAVEVWRDTSDDRPLHVRTLRDLGLLLGELFDLDELAADCAADGVYEFFFAAMPLPVVNAVGSPLNPVAIK